ncbi:MAG TPA: trypsin-like peptidase domain-containing protein [Blastocatellia bacterium]|nr:trypsin-like peptidase domain-containing protein [Blastocatellia bacterium]
MERIILRHLSGSKANQVEEFPLAHFRELTIGRDPSSTVKYDPDRDDLVGRQHARVIRDSAHPGEFLITDLGSRNGTFVNKQRIVGTAKVVPGDVVQFGAGGPEFQFDLEPRPASDMRPTRIGAETNVATFTPTAMPPTRAGGQTAPMGAPMSGAPAMSGPAPTGGPGGQVGRATVERMISQTKSESRRNVIIVGLILLVLVGAAVAYLLLRPQPKTDPTVTNPGDPTLMTAAQIASAYTNSTVYIEFAWKLINLTTGEQAYHYYLPNRTESGGPLVEGGPAALACYVVVQGKNGQRIEPALDFEGKQGIPIGGGGTGSGFVVTSDGFILTNRHVGASWRTSYHFPQGAERGILVAQLRNGRYAPLPGQDGRVQIVEAPSDWVPGETLQAGMWRNAQIAVEGRNDLLNVTFAKNELRFPAHLVRTSDRHDVAMVKIDVPETLTKCEFNDNYDTIKPGEPLTVLGYPGIAPPQFGVVFSQDRFNQSYTLRTIPNPTVSTGNIGSIHRGQMKPNDPVVSSFGDYYQLTVNSTGGGNSGGPVFDDHGKVIGIFTAGKWEPGAAISFAVPIRYGKELMGINPVTN